MSDQKMIWAVAGALLLTLAALALTEALNSNIDRQTQEKTLPAAREALSEAYRAMGSERPAYASAAELLEERPNVAELLARSGPDAQMSSARESSSDYVLTLYNISLGGDHYGLLSLQATGAGVVATCGAYERDSQTGYHRLDDSVLEPVIACENGSWEPTGLAAPERVITPLEGDNSLSN